MKKFSLTISIGILLLIVNGCSIFPDPGNVEIHYYDIGFPDKSFNPGVGINVLAFSGSVGNETRMIFRNNSNQIQFDTFNRWSFSPGRLIQRYISLSFDDRKISEVKYDISGDILRFDNNLANNTATISLKLEIRNSKSDELISSEIYTSSIPAKEKTATAYAEAMQKAMDQIIEKITVQLKMTEGK